MASAQASTITVQPFILCLPGPEGTLGWPEQLRAEIASLFAGGSDRVGGCTHLPRREPQFHVATCQEVAGALRELRRIGAYPADVGGQLELKAVVASSPKVS